MKTIEFLNTYGLDEIRKHSINVRIEDTGQINLQYGILNSDSELTKELMRECRGLVVEKGQDNKFSVVSRCFDKFANINEKSTLHLTDEELQFSDKLHGTMIKVYQYKDHWYIGTKGAATAGESTEFRKEFRDEQGTGISFIDLTYEALSVKDYQQFKQLMDKQSAALNKPTFIFELYGPNNRVLTPYETTQISLLAVRETTGEYVDVSQFKDLNPIKSFKSTPRKVYEMAQKLPGLLEGFVGYQNGVPVIKVKSERYVRHHHLATDVSVDKMIFTAIFNGERDEILAYQPRLKPIFDRIEGDIQKLYDDAEAFYENNKHLSKGKEFSFAAKSEVFSKYLCQAHKDDMPVLEKFNQYDANLRHDFLLRNLRKLGKFID